jgi:hypothetical protein
MAIWHGFCERIMGGLVPKWFDGGCRGSVDFGRGFLGSIPVSIGKYGAFLVPFLMSDEHGSSLEFFREKRICRQKLVPVNFF